MYVCMYVCMYIFMYVCVYVCMYVCMYLCVYIYIYIYIYISLGGGIAHRLSGLWSPRLLRGSSRASRGSTAPRPGTSHGLNPCRGMRGRGVVGSPAASRRRPAVPAPFGGVLASSESSPNAGGFRPCGLPDLNSMPDPPRTSLQRASNKQLYIYIYTHVYIYIYIYIYTYIHTFIHTYIHT